MAPGMKFPHKGEIWHVNGDPTMGREFQGPHYYLVITDKQLVKALGVATCVPITTGGSAARSAQVTVMLDGGSTDKGSVTGVALCYMLRSMDLKARGARYHSTVEAAVMREVLDKVVDLIDPQ
ncbi:type II toxin-antitoxin system PemK/MazF family toxin [Siccibacter colletis]|uniref:type II toxin-antitoxin system PemK/MazF family toxin n=1 Tax=Siccibacter colletis TaxID=1505757 RepID=UPI0028BEF4CB|nr:type II toxin-antitoxin system PemK/MazF family toxin [Siccibacter colletis]WNN48615.1 type II toxin-antitoxin system PemK/MazF family toxin [Siccibacter colletis]